MTKQNKKRVAIIGGGFCGLSSAINFVDEGMIPTIFEGSDSLGGLAGSFKGRGWKWPLEIFYHHVFTNDGDILSMAEKVGALVKILTPETNSFISGKEIRLDSPVSVMRFSELSLLSRIWMGFGLAILKMIKNGLFLEKYLVVDLLPKLIGKEAYRKVWERLLRAKFGPYAEKVNMAWFWTRVAKRTKSLGYFEGGFSNLVERARLYITKRGGQVKLKHKVENIEKKGAQWIVDGEVFDAVLVTTPAPVAQRIMPENTLVFPETEYLWGETLVLELKKSLVKGYWVNILENNWPFLVAVEHTNLINKRYYGNKHVVYLGNYLADGDPRLQMNKDELLNLFSPYIKKLNQGFKKSDIVSSHLFKAPFAQPVFEINRSKRIPGFRTNEERIYVANMSMVYPFDRGTNYAVKMGNDVAKMIIKDL